jgi:hypothetical protein
MMEYWSVEKIRHQSYNHYSNTTVLHHSGNKLSMQPILSDLAIGPGFL